MRTTWINDRWPLLLPKHRADRPEWPWWEAGRLASMWHHLGRMWPGMKPSTSHDLDHSRLGMDLFKREVVYDIGAEEGDFPALFSSWGCDVVLFEPNDRVWPNIKAIWAANELRPPLACFSGFAGPEDGAYLVTAYDPSDPDSMPGWPGSVDDPVIHDHGFRNIAEKVDSDYVITIDTMATLVAPPTAITIDCEGAEFEVLLGAQRTLAEHKPKCWISVHPEFAAEMYQRDQVLEDIQSLFAAAGYENWRGTFLAMDHEWHYYWGPE